MNRCHPSFQAREQQVASHVQGDLEWMAAKESPNAPWIDMEDIREMSVSFHCSPTPEMPAPEWRIIFAGKCWAVAMMTLWRAVKVFKRRNLTGVKSGLSYASELVSSIVDEGARAGTDVLCCTLRFRYSIVYFCWLFHGLVIFSWALWTVRETFGLGNPP